MEKIECHHLYGFSKPKHYDIKVDSSLVPIVGYFDCSLRYFNNTAPEELIKIVNKFDIRNTNKHILVSVEYDYAPRNWRFINKDPFHLSNPELMHVYSSKPFMVLDQKLSIDMSDVHIPNNVSVKMSNACSLGRWDLFREPTEEKRLFITVLETDLGIPNNRIYRYK